MSTRKICPHYVKDKKCSYEEYCIEQLLSDEKVCTSKIYYAMSLEQQLDQLKAENKTQKETIDGFLTILDKLGKSNIKLRETITEIKEIAKNTLQDVEYLVLMMNINAKFVC